MSAAPKLVQTGAKSGTGWGKTLKEETWTPPSLDHHVPTEVTPLSPDVEAILPEKKITAAGLMILLYFWTCGGPFGVESAVGSGGALLTWAGMLLASFFWSLPQAFMAAELSLMIDVNGGNIIWVKRAFGDFAAFVNAHCYLILNLSTLSLLVVLFVEYIPISFSEYATWGLRASFVCVVVIVNMIGVGALAKLSTIFLVIIFSPFFIQMIAIVLFRVPVLFDNLLWVPPLADVKWGVFISTIVWSFGGFDSIGSVAGDVKGGKKTFLLGVMGSFPLCLMNYFWPIMLDFIIDKDLNNWQPGYFTQIVYAYFPEWLGVWITVAAAISNFAQCSSGLAPVAWNVWAMARGAETGVEYLPPFLGWEWQRRPGGTIRPVAAILFTGIAILVITVIPFDILIQTYLLLRIVNLLFEYSALIWLKYKEPETPRPYKVPGGIVGAILLTIPTLGISGLSIYFADRQAIIIGGVVIVFIICMWPVILFVKLLLKQFRTT